MTLTFSIQDIFQLIDGSTTSSKPSLQSMDAYWKASLRWIQGQLISDRKVLIPNFAFIINGESKQNRPLLLQILHNVLQSRQLVHKQQLHQFCKPVVTLHYAGISKMLSKDEQPEHLIPTLEKLFNIIVGLLTEENVIIDLDVLGKITVHNKLVEIEPFVRHKKKLEGKMIVSQMVVNKQNSFRIKTKIKEANDIDEQREIRGQKLSVLNQSITSQSLKMQKIAYSPNLGATKSNIKSGFTKYLDMLGQVSDPLGRGYNFSDLIKSPNQLLKTNFIKSDFCQPRFPPILDNSVRTLSAPITNQKYNLSICGRIGCNYNKSARSLYFDHKSRCIKKYVQVEGIKFKAQPALLEVPATDAEELLFLSENHKEYSRKVHARQKCYERYNEYIMKQLPHTLVKPIDNAQIKRILQQSGVNSTVSKNPLLEEVINKNLQLIVKDYYYSGRKVILDYTLRDDEERQRIGIVEILKEQSPWGSGTKGQLEFSSETRRYIKESRNKIQQHLSICNSALVIKQNWLEYKKQLFIVIPSQTSATNLLYFIKKQQQKISQVRELLRNKWRQSVIALVKQDIKLIKHKEKVTSLYRSTDAIMVNLLRQLIEDSLYKYLQFIQRFKKATYRTVRQILQENNNTQTSFLTVKLKVEGRSIIFAENLSSHVKVQLLGLLQLIIDESKDFPSISSHESTLWEMGKQDEVYGYCYGKIELIIDDNIAEIQKAVDVYQEYESILHRQGEIEEWCAENHSIQEYNNYINQIQLLSDTILEQLPFTIRMNMIVVDGTDLKKKYISTLLEIKNYIYEKIYEKIKKFYIETKNKIEIMKTAMKHKVDTPLRWVEMEEKIINIKKIEVPQLKDQFANLKKWMNLLFNQGSDLLTQDDLNQIFLISKDIHNLPSLLYNEEQRVSIEKEQIQHSLKQQLTNFVESLNKLSKQLQDMIKQFTVRRQCSNYNDLLKRITNKYEEALNMRKEINAKEKHLGWGVTKFSELQKINKSLSLTTEFWNIIGVIDMKIKAWRDSSVKNIIPDELDQFLQNNLGELKRMYDTDLGKDILPSEVIKEVNKELIDMNEKYMPLVRIFANKGLKERHWQAFAKQFSICENKQTLTLNKLITYKIHQSFDKIDILTQISEIATKQFAVEKEKIKMIEEWFPLALVPKVYNDTDLMIIGTQFQPLMNLLSSQLEKTEKLKELEEARIFQQNLTQWQLWLKYTESLFAEWIKVQNSWCHLYPIFCDQEIVKNFPLEHSEFQSITNSWKSVIRRVQEQPRIVELTKNKKMLDIFLESNMKLSVMQNTINTFIAEREAGKQEGNIE